MKKLNLANFFRFTSIILIVTGLLFVILLLFSVAEYYSVSEAALRPYRAEVWGTVSDWVMVGVTALTAVVIWRTLESQRIVQKDQAEATRIQFANRKRTIVPRLKINKFQFSPNSTCYINLFLENGSLIDMEVMIDCYYHINDPVYKVTIKYPLISVDKEFQIPIDFDPRGYSMRLYMDFKDIDGSPYRQVFGIYVESDGQYRVNDNEGIIDLTIPLN
jgi:hypothetical protein